MDIRTYVDMAYNFGKNLKYLRNKKGITLSTLSKELDIPKGTLSSLECGYNLANTDRLKRLAEFYSVTRYETLFMNHDDFKRKF